MCGSFIVVAPSDAGNGVFFRLCGGSYSSFVLMLFKIDVWGLGCVLYFMLVGHTPFANTDGSKASKKAPFEKFNENKLRRNVSKGRYEKVFLSAATSLVYRGGTTSNAC